MSSFFVYNKNRERIGMLQNEDSVQWLEAYQAVGEAKIIARATKENIELLIEDNIVYNTDSECTGIVKFVDITEYEAENTITARLVFTSGLLGERVIMATERITNAEEGMYRILKNNLRALPINVRAAEGYTKILDTEITWGSVLDAYLTLCEASGLGFKVKFNPETGANTLIIYQGVDRSERNSGAYVGYLSPQIGDIHDIQIINDSTDYKNVAIIAGEDRSVNRVVRIVSIGSPVGEDRREIFVDAKDLQKEYQVATPTGEFDGKGNPIYTYEQKIYSDTEYNALLDARGYEKLAEHKKKFSLSCKIDQTNMVFGKDYFLGDRMPIKITEYGINATGIISSALRIYERTGESIIATLSQIELR